MKIFQRIQNLYDEEDTINIESGPMFGLTNPLFLIMVVSDSLCGN